MDLSIIIPVYNGEKYIENCIYSIINKIKDNVEIIVVNDGSTDSTITILKRLSKKNKMLKIFNNKNKGVSFSRNFGIKNASGKYLIFLDADDFLSDDWSKILDVISKEEFDYLLCSNIDLSKSLDKSSLILHTVGLNNNTGYYFSTPWSKVYRRNFLLENNICFSEDIINGEDELFNIKVILIASKIRSEKLSIYNYRISKVSLTKSFNEKIYKSDYKFKEELKKLLEISDLTDDKKNDIIDFIEFNSYKMLINRISYVSKYATAKKLYLKVKVYNSKYCDNMLDKFIQYLHKNKFYFCIFLIYKFKNLIRSLKKEQIIKI